MHTCISLHGLKRSWRSCPRRVNAGNKNTPSTHHPRRRNVTTLMVWLENGHIRKNLTQSGEPQRYSWGTQQKKKKKKSVSYQSYFHLIKIIPGMMTVDFFSFLHWKTWVLYVSIVCFSFIAYFQQYAEYDAFITSPDPSSPWITDNTESWDQERTLWETCGASGTGSMVLLIF